MVINAKQKLHVVSDILLHSWLMKSRESGNNKKYQSQSQQTPWQPKTPWQLKLHRAYLSCTLVNHRLMSCAEVIYIYNLLG